MEKRSPCFCIGQRKKFEKRLLPFTTEHKVHPKLRNKKGRTEHAEFKTSDPVIIEALYRDSAYGKNFYEKGDPNGKKKKTTLLVNEKDKKIVALRGLFKAVGLPLDEELPYDVLTEQYAIHMNALGGNQKPGKGEAALIPHTPVNLLQQMAETADEARKIFEDKYGEPVPEIVNKDVAFLSALGDPDFDALGYIKDLETGAPKADKNKDAKTGPVEKTNEELYKDYFEMFGKNVPNTMKKDRTWILKKLKEGPTE